MRRPLAIPTLLTVVLAVLLAAAGPASAKGPTSVTVVGPGIPKLTVDHWTEPDEDEDVDVGTLSEVSGIFGIFGDGSLGDAPSITKAELGPRYVLTWYEVDQVMAVSHVYPFAAGGAWTEIPPGQRLWGETLRSGWWHGGDALRDAMVALGAVDPGSAGDTAGDAAGDKESTSDEVTAAGTLPPDAGSSGGWWPTAGAVVAAVGVCAVFAGWVLRRRRTSSPVLTLSEPV